MGACILAMENGAIYENASINVTLWRITCIVDFCLYIEVRTLLPMTYPISSIVSFRQK